MAEEDDLCSPNSSSSTRKSVVNDFDSMVINLRVKEKILKNYVGGSFSKKTHDRVVFRTEN